MKNDDNVCFMWSILSAIYSVNKHPQRVSKYKECENKLNFKGNNFPVSLNDTAKFE